MRVIDVLELPSMRQAVVVSGHAGLTREVSSAMILEAPDIENWGREGQLIITSFFALRDLDDGGLESFFLKLESIGISALVFKIERLVSEIPETVTRLSENCSIPVIRVPKSARYEPIMVDVLSKVINSNVRLLERFYNAHRQTMALALTEPTESDILLELKGAIRADATFYSLPRDRRVGTCPSKAGFSSFEVRERTERDPYQSFHYFDATLGYPGGEKRHALAISVPSSDGCRYYLIIHQGDTRLSRLDIMVIENFVSLLQMEVLKRNALDKQTFIKNNSLAHDLLLDRFRSPEAAARALDELGLALYPLYQILLVRVRLKGQGMGDRSALETVLAALRRAIACTCGVTAYYENNDRFSLVVNLPDGHPPIGTDVVVRAIEGVVSRGTLPRFSYLVAFSLMGGVGDIPSLNREVLAVSRLLGELGDESRCVRYEDLGILRLLLDLPDGVLPRQYLDPRVVELMEGRPELFKTLVAFYRCGSNYQETAARLFVHPKTVRYRVHQAERLVGIDVGNPDDLMQIAFAGKMVEVMGKDS